MAQQQAKHAAVRQYNRQRLQDLQRPFEFDTRVSALLAAKRTAALTPRTSKRPRAFPCAADSAADSPRAAALKVRFADSRCQGLLNQRVLSSVH